jgi:hypothetical protein
LALRKLRGARYTLTATEVSLRAHRIPAFFAPSTFFLTVSAQLVAEACGERRQHQQSGEQAEPDKRVDGAAALLLGRCCRAGYAAIVADAFWNELRPGANVAVRPARTQPKAGIKVRSKLSRPATHECAGHTTQMDIIPKFWR